MTFATFTNVIPTDRGNNVCRDQRTERIVPIWLDQRSEGIVPGKAIVVLEIVGGFELLN